MPAIALSSSEKQRLRASLLAWFAQRKRDLPWRKSADPYRVWLSEIMLQQTRVAVVVPYFEKFLARFPDVKALARSRIEPVLSSWAGLGYYSRARNVHRAAKALVALHGGEFPRNHDAAMALPGIGAYTAAAVLSIAYGAPLAALDGNVARVIARLTAELRELRMPAVWRELQESAQNLLAQKAAGDWNQAMMELGATICVPISPKCDQCPVARWCEARKLGLTSKIPAKRKKPKVVEVTLAAAVLIDPEGRTLLLKTSGTDAALFSRMWQFPAIETMENYDDSTSRLAQHLQNELGIGAIEARLTPLAFARHCVTFRRIRLEPYLLHVDVLPQLKDSRTPRLDRFGRLPISNATRKIVTSALAHLAIRSGDSRPVRSR